MLCCAAAIKPHWIPACAGMTAGFECMRNDCFSRDSDCGYLQSAASRHMNIARHSSAGWNPVQIEQSHSDTTRRPRIQVLSILSRSRAPAGECIRLGMAPPLKKMTNDYFLITVSWPVIPPPQPSPAREGGSSQPDAQSGKLTQLKGIIGCLPSFPSSCEEYVRGAWRLPLKKMTNDRFLNHRQAGR